MIQFKNVGFAYAGTTASEIGVKHIDLFVETGECVLLCGRSGQESPLASIMLFAIVSSFLSFSYDVASSDSY